MKKSNTKSKNYLNPVEFAVKWSLKMETSKRNIHHFTRSGID